MIDLIPEMILVTLLVIAAMYDLFYAKIPNRVILSGMILSLLTNLFCVGREGLINGLMGMWMSFLTGIVIFAFGVLGAGDVKLFVVIGAFLGVRSVLGSFVYSMIIGAVEGGFKMLLAERWRRFPNKKVTVRFAFPMLLGTLGVLISR